MKQTNNNIIQLFDNQMTKIAKECLAEMIAPRHRYLKSMRAHMKLTADPALCYTGTFSGSVYDDDRFLSLAAVSDPKKRLAAYKKWYLGSRNNTDELSHVQNLEVLKRLSKLAKDLVTGDLKS